MLRGVWGATARAPAHHTHSRVIATRSSVGLHCPRKYSISRSRGSTVYSAYNNLLPLRTCSTNQTQTQIVSRKEQLKELLRKYGKVAVVFHVTMSAVSLSSCYLLVHAVGIDPTTLANLVGYKGSLTGSDLAIAYLLHKVEMHRCAVNHCPGCLASPVRTDFECYAHIG